MPLHRSPFLTGALAWIYGGASPESCETCGYSWTTDVGDAIDTIEDAPGRYAALLDGRDGMAPSGDGGWNATAYLWHLTDLARSWSERWVQIRAVPGSLLAGWDPDVLAAARNYQALPTAAALWALRDATDSFVALSRESAPDLTFEHGDWGTGTVADGVRWLAHEYHHHQLDVGRRVR